ncbi:hypothetical protein Nepgr_002223 [Nepenthes gracilis]|uniref:Uncharacterized protein n=1 Tax=Nepenthes gracilis TaxID=150966 RepID=A0AAD3P9E4_NEPGR|nr:hypothetical protein Nepgr_002223 [Nepenthes gracilis]
MTGSLNVEWMLDRENDRAGEFSDPVNTDRRLPLVEKHRFETGEPVEEKSPSSVKLAALCSDPLRNNPGFNSLSCLLSSS